MKLFSKTLIVCLSLLLISIGCKEDEAEFVQPPSAVSFNVDEASVKIDPKNPVYEITLQTTAAFAADKVIPFAIVHDTLDELENTAPKGYYTLGNNEITIPKGGLTGSTTIEFDTDSLGYVEKGLKFMLKEGDYITNVTRDEFTLNVIELCPFKEVILTITTDDYPDETTYELYDVSASPVLLQEGGPFDGLEETDIPITFCLDTGSYAVVVYDSYGDGITSGGFSVSVDGQELVNKTVAGSYAIGYFDIP